jgi:hypothetical protein
VTTNDNRELTTFANTQEPRMRVDWR